MDVQDYVFISKQEYDYAQSLPKLKMLTNFTQLYREEIRGYGAIDYTGQVVYTEMLSSEVLVKSFLQLNNQ